MGFFSLPKPEVWIDPGSRITRIFYKDEILEEEPTLIAEEETGGRFLAAGSEALALMQSDASANGKYRFIWPIKGGISDFQAFEEYLRALLYRHTKKFSKFGLFQPTFRMIFITASRESDVETRAWRDVAQHTGAAEIYFINKSALMLLGLGINPTTTPGSAIIDIGSAKTEISVFVNVKPIAREVVSIGQSHFIKSVQLHYKRKHDQQLTEHEAHQLLKTDNTVLEWVGKYYEIIQEMLWPVLDALPPEAAKAVAPQGIYLCGGGATNLGIQQALNFDNKIQLHLLTNEGKLMQQGIQYISPEVNRELFNT